MVPLGLFVALPVAFHAPAQIVRASGWSAHSPTLQAIAGAELDYEKIVASELPFLSRAEAADYLDAQSTRAMLAKSMGEAASEAVIAEALEIIAGDQNSGDVDWTLVAFGMAEPPTGFKIPQRSTEVRSWYDSGVRLAEQKDQGSFEPCEPAGWGLVPECSVEAEYETVAASIASNSALVSRLHLQLISERAQLAKLESARAIIAKSRSQQAAKPKASPAKPHAVAKTVGSKGLATEGSTNKAALGGLAAAVAAAALYYVKFTGGDPSAISSTLG